jgi:hypothetical protein
VTPSIVVILGPAACKNCGELVLYGRAKGIRGKSASALRWRDPETAKLHWCRCAMDTPDGPCVRTLAHAGDCRSKWHVRHGKHAA